jgi:hypothetical protein
MKAFGILEAEKVVQIGDKTRLSAVKTFLTQGASAITKVEIQPEASELFVEISGTNIRQAQWLLDWVYDTGGPKIVTLQITQADLTVSTFTQTLEVVTDVEDNLWSDDQDLMTYESDILKWLPDGKSTFKFVHRRAQRLILDWLDEVRVYARGGKRLEKEDMQKTEDLRRLSAMWTLELIFQGISNRTDDVFAQKSAYYMDRRKEAQSRGRIQADFNQNGEEDMSDNQDMRTFFMVRR